jgi:hypothetical protein
MGWIYEFVLHGSVGGVLFFGFQPDMGDGRGFRCGGPVLNSVVKYGENSKYKNEFTFVLI